MTPAEITLAIIAAAACGGCGFLLMRQQAGKRPTSRPQRHRLNAREVLDAIPDPFFVVDPLGTATHVNVAAATLFAPRAASGRPLVEILGDSRLAAPYRECRDTGSAVSRQIILPPEASPARAAVAGAGENLWLADAAPLPGAGPGFCRLLLRDLSAGHQLEQIRKDFVANASHELRTPITLVGGYLETFIESPGMLDDRESTLRQLGIMRKHTDRISHIIEDMLLLSRIEAGGASAMKMETFPLAGCVNDIVERLDPLIRERRATVGIELHDPDVTLHGDRFYWTQVYFNLIENALKQNPREGLAVVVRSRVRGDTLVMEVGDNGIGIPAADLPFIFKRFYRVEKHHSQNQIKGTGLGLSIVRRAVESHGGTITCESSPGIRTIFRMEIPNGKP